MGDKFYPTDAQIRQTMEYEGLDLPNAYSRLVKQNVRAEIEDIRDSFIVGDTRELLHRLLTVVDVIAQESL